MNGDATGKTAPHVGRAKVSVASISLNPTVHVPLCETENRAQRSNVTSFPLRPKPLVSAPRKMPRERQPRCYVTVGRTNAAAWDRFSRRRKPICHRSRCKNDHSSDVHFDRPELMAEALIGTRVLYNTYWVQFNRGDVTHERAVANTIALFRAAGSEREFVEQSGNTTPRAKSSVAPILPGGWAAQQRCPALMLLMLRLKHHERPNDRHAGRRHNGPGKARKPVQGSLLPRHPE